MLNKNEFSRENLTTLFRCKCGGSVFLNSKNVKECTNEAFGCRRQIENPRNFFGKKDPQTNKHYRRHCDCGWELIPKRNSFFGDFYECKRRCYTSQLPVAHFTECLCGKAIKHLEGHPPRCVNHKNCGSFEKSRVTVDENTGWVDFLGYEFLSYSDKIKISHFLEKYRYRKLCCYEVHRRNGRKRLVAGISYPCIDCSYVVTNVKRCCLLLKPSKFVNSACCFSAIPLWVHHVCEACQEYCKLAQEKYGNVIDFLEQFNIYVSRLDNYNPFLIKEEDLKNSDREALRLAREMGDRMVNTIFKENLQHQSVNKLMTKFVGYEWTKK